MPTDTADTQKSREEKRLILIGIFLLLGVITLYLWFCPFKTSIDQTITASVYKDDVIIDTTTVTMQGEKSSYLLQGTDSYTGLFAIAYVDSTCPQGADYPTPVGNVTWWPTETQALSYMHGGLSKSFGIRYLIVMNDDMTEFAIALDDGSIIASSDAMRQAYLEQYEL